MPHLVLSPFHPLSPQSWLFQPASPTLTLTHLLAFPLHSCPTLSTVTILQHPGRQVVLIPVLQVSKPRLREVK